MAFLQSLSGPLLDSNLFVVFSSNTLRWQFATTEWTPFYEAYLEYYVVLSECSIIIVLDCASFVKLRHIHRIVSAHPTHVCFKVHGCAKYSAMVALLGAAYQLAIAIVIMAFLFTCGVCGFSLFIIFNTTHLRASTFGDICTVQMVSDITLITLNTVWCLVKAWSHHPTSPVSDQTRVAMVVGVTSKTLYFFTCKLHVLMAINRYFFIFHATDHQHSESHIAIVQRSYSHRVHTSISSVSCRSTYGLSDPNLFVVFSSQSLQWYFAVTERTLAYESYLEYYVVLAECTIIIVLNVASFVKLKQLHSMVPALNFQFASDQFQITKNKCTTASEQRLFMQSVCQLIPLTSVMILFFFITPLCESAFLAFLCSTAAWHFGIALDGVIIVIFQAKFQCGIPRLNTVKVST
ncbi:hypothetical protein PRIPAC_78453 [Pristionchus pacificus]|uniref:G protein-coupled receptor n=1 Tax=Pristionchus pacificus TaxID=54126 RepID=A0A2A6CPY6_PRIPA|nr:hypothetical protein PRIPAC_78453 [Pristionchus pacificus]|eukprot:PDM80101.1 G protein-coupled receptor [Pristionchus pacificus]